jgi:hypothetical protein|tara:strand:+ start:107 stop:217 length:111 start_codon:yes stop_codon:yes gene_type:complete
MINALKRHPMSLQIPDVGETFDKGIDKVVAEGMNKT